MKLRVHERSPKPETMTLDADPMIVWLSREHELVIERGDRLSRVASAIIEHWGLGPSPARHLAAFWFAIGERRARRDVRSPWTKKELRISLYRRYLTRVR